LLWIALAVAICAVDAPARAQDAIALAPTQGDATLEPLALGLDRWLLSQLEAAGLAVAAIEAGGGGIPDALAIASDQGFGHMLMPRLVARDGEASVRLLIYAADTGSLINGARSEAPTADLGRAAVEVLATVVSMLGGPGSLELTPPLLDDLTSASQSMRARRAGDLVGAFRAVQGKLSPIAMGLREEILEESRQSSTPSVARARVLAAIGDSVTAWSLIGRQARSELTSPDPDPDLLVAAGEVLLARGALREAHSYFSQALVVAPDHLYATAGLAQVLEQQGDTAGAWDKLSRASQLAPGSPRYPEKLAELDADPAMAAGHWIEAGRRAAKRLDARRARSHFDTASEMDPTAAARANAALGALEERLGHPKEAQLAYRRAVRGGARAPVVLAALGRTEHRLGDTPAAERTLHGALKIAPKDPDALRELGVVYTETDRAADALPLLREAHDLDPSDSRTRMTMSRALRLTGDAEEALNLLTTRPGEAGPETLAEIASIQAEQGNLEAARASFAKAVELAPAEPELRRELAVVLEKLGDAAGALAARQLASMFSVDGGEARPQHAHANVLSLDDLVVSFASQLRNASSRAVIALGVREPQDWKTKLWHLVRPRSPDLGLIEHGLQAAIDARFTPADMTAEAADALSVHVDQLYDFDNDQSLSAETIATVNHVLAIDGTFVTRVIAHDRAALASCRPGTFGVEMRLLLGRDAETASILSNFECLDGGFEAYGSLNLLALPVYAAVFILLTWPLFRGWGQIVVRIKLPERTKGLLSIHITKRPDQVKRQVDEKTQREKSRGSRFDFLMRYQRQIAGAESIFRLIPARKLPYTVTVSGPLMDARGEEVIGHFLEEQRVTVRRRRASMLLFDFCPKEVAVEVTVKEGNRPAQGARISVLGDPSSLRYTRDGMAYLYLGIGSYTILVGSRESAAQFEIEISSLDRAIPLQVDLGRAEGLLFSGCPEAVDPYLQSDLAAAAEALEAADNAQAASLLRGELYRQQGRADEAAREFESAGQMGEAAEMRTSGADFEGGAELFEEAGEVDRAAAAYREAGAWAEAARCYEQIYDYANALECWREIGDGEREMLMLERLGEFMEAAAIARERGDREQVLVYLQHVEPRHSEYGDACRLIAEIASEDGDHELAVAKFEEALSATGIENASVKSLESYAAVLERAGRKQEALSAYEAIRRQEVGRTDVAARIEELKRELAHSDGATQHMVTRREPEETRYELIEEIGRGGMGVVYKARDKRLGREVALKRLPENLRDHPAAVELFEREARAAAALNHVNIVTLFDAGEEGGAYFITMELLEGRTVNSILELKGRVSVADTMRLGIQICAGLHYAHERGIVHRDIKTANLFFTNEQVVKIMDFGIAKSIEEVRRSTTIVGGTPYYMAPEQSGGESVDQRADLYALGVTLFQLATGHLPFEDGDVAYRHRHEDPPDPRELNMEIPTEFAELILQLMQKAASDRPANAATVGTRLGELLSQLG
jgi:tetratricopeptide (TPR) repeat protein